MDEESMVDQAKRILLYEDIDRFSGPKSGYRNRVDLSFFPSGLGMRKTFDSFIDTERIDIATPKVNEIIGQVRSLIDVDTFDQKRKSGALRYAVIRCLDTSCVSFVVNAKADLSLARSAIEEFSRTTDAHNVLITYMHPDSDMSIGSEYDVIKGSEFLEATLGGAKLKVHAQGFFQNNTQMAQTMHDYIKESLSSPRGLLIDLYGGVGAFACSFGSRFERAVVIEEHEGAASIAAENLSVNGVRGEAVCADASALLDYAEQDATVITDPPRTGMSEKAVRALVRMRPERIIYVSCNPIIAPRDLAYLSGYSIEKAAVFDMFPGTDHFEMVVMLTRN